MVNTRAAVESDCARIAVAGVDENKSYVSKHDRVHVV